MAPNPKSQPLLPTPTTRWCRLQQQLESMLAALHESGSFAFDTETTSLDPMQANLVGLSFATAPGRAWYVPVGHNEGAQLPLEEVLAQVRPLLESPDLAKCAHNANYDMAVLAGHGIECRNLDFDTMIAAHLLGKNAIGLKNLSLDVLGLEMTPISQLIGTGRKQLTFDQVSIESALPYAAADADMTGRLRRELEGQLANEGLTSLLNEMEMPLTPVLVTMQRHGIKLDAGALHEMSRDLNLQLQQVETDLYRSIGHAVNINSPQQLSDVLFNELGLPKTKRTKTGYSTDANSLEMLRGLHPVVDQILGIPADIQAQVHLRGRPARDGQPGHRAHSHQLQPDGLRHRPHFQQRPQPAEHPHTH